MSGKLRLNGATSGYSELQAPDVAGDQTFTLPSVGGTLSTGGILQVVEGSTSTLVSNTDILWLDTGLSATITPSSPTSKIFVVINQAVQLYRNNADQGFGIRVLRNSDIIDNPIMIGGDPLSKYVSVNNGTAVNFYDIFSRMLLDEPNSTGAVTYKTQGRPYRSDGSGQLNCQPDGDNPGTSNIYLIEVAL